MLVGSVIATIVTITYAVMALAIHMNRTTARLLLSP